MKLKELVQLILDSTPEDWKKIRCWGAFTGPSYRERFDFFKDDENNLMISEVEQHHTVLVYRLNISITIAYGLESNDNFKEDFLHNFSDHSATSQFVDVFYNGALVFRSLYVVVDGGRCKLPIPSYQSDDKNHLFVTQEYYNFIKFIESADAHEAYHSDFDHYFKISGITIVDKPWKY